MTKQIILMKTDLSMSFGKMAAQAVHASNMFFVDYISDIAGRVLSPVEYEWVYVDPTVIVLASSTEEFKRIVHTAKGANIKVYEWAEPDMNNVVTCCSIGPETNDTLDMLTGHLPLLSEKSKIAGFCDVLWQKLFG